jgi:hypothetical protein
LYYQTYADDRTVIPATSKLLFGQVVDHYDVDVFWNVMTRFFGQQCIVLASLDNAEVAGALRRIRESEEWADFAAMYLDTLRTVDDTLWAQPNDLIATFNDKRPGHSTTFILKRLWARRKIDLAGAAFGAAGLAATQGPFSTAETAGATAAGVAGLAFAGTGLLRNLGKFMNEYRQQDIIKIRSTIKREVSQVLRTVRGQAKSDD